MDGNALHRMRIIKDLEKENSDLEWLLSDLKRNANKTLERIEESERQKMSGQWAMFSCRDGKYEFVAIMDEGSDEQDDDEMAEVALIMPLPKHETLREFDGF